MNGLADLRVHAQAGQIQADQYLAWLQQERDRLASENAAMRALLERVRELGQRILVANCEGEVRRGDVTVMARELEQLGKEAQTGD